MANNKNNKERHDEERPPDLSAKPLCTIGRKRKPEQTPTDSPDQARPQSAIRKNFKALNDQSGNCGIEDGTCPINMDGWRHGSSNLDGGVQRGKEDEVAATFTFEHINSLWVGMSHLHARYLRVSKAIWTFIHCSNCLAPLEKCQLCSKYRKFTVHCNMCKVENCPEKDCVHMRKLAAHHRYCRYNDCLVCSDVRRLMAGEGLILRDPVDKTPDLAEEVSSRISEFCEWRLLC